jgi:hypothetical protein
MKRAIQLALKRDDGSGHAQRDEKESGDKADI